MTNQEYRERRKKSYLERRKKSWDIAMKEFPEGLTKHNLKQVQKRVKELENE
jgi:hypothetical protein